MPVFVPFLSAFLSLVINEGREGKKKKKGSQNKKGGKGCLPFSGN
jgi:hypothetical protein